MAVKVFISYAHKDEQFKDGLVEHISMHKQGSAQLIPIVVRAVDWSDSELSKVQGLPKDAVPIASWTNEDEAWVNVIGGIKKHIQEFKPKLQPIKKAVSEGIEISDKTNAWLSDTEIVLTHRKVNQVSLENIYVVPDVELDSENDLVDIKPAKYLLKNLGHHIISGEEQQGKTSLLKYLYRELLKNSFLPVYLDALSIKKASTEQVISIMTFHLTALINTKKPLF